MARALLLRARMTTAAAQAVKPTPSRLPLVLALVGVNLAAVAGLAAYVVLGATPAASADAPAPSSDRTREIGPLVEFESMVVNLAAGDDYEPRYIKVTFQIEASNAEDAAMVAGRLPAIRDHVLRHLAGRDAESVSGGANVELVRAELIAGIREVTGEGAVRDIYFTEYLVQ